MQQQPKGVFTILADTTCTLCVPGQPLHAEATAARGGKLPAGKTHVLEIRPVREDDGMVRTYYLSFATNEAATLVIGAIERVAGESVMLRVGVIV